MKRKIYQIFTIMACIAVSVTSCKDNKVVLTSENPAECVTNESNLNMLRSLVSLDSLGRFYEMDYTADYKLDEMLKANVSDMNQLVAFFAKNLFDKAPQAGALMNFGAGCSAFAAINPENGDKLMGRNYDYCHVENGEEVPITALLIKTTPENGKKSISMVDTYWLGYHQGFYTDGKSDLSMLMGAPYNMLDGINEDGFALGVLHLKGHPAIQKDPSKPTIWITVAMRMLLDRASTVDEAIEMLKQYNMNMETPALGSDHFFLADANGDYAIVEYTFDEGADVLNDNPNKMLVMKGQDHSYVTNFYNDPALAEDDSIGGKSSHGMARYEILRNKLTMNVYKLNEQEAIELLGVVAQDPKPTENTSHTQWSSLYNLTKRTLDISILQEYGKKYSYKVGS